MPGINTLCKTSSFRTQHSIIWMLSTCRAWASRWSPVQQLLTESMKKPYSLLLTSKATFIPLLLKKISQPSALAASSRLSLTCKPAISFLFSLATQSAHQRIAHFPRGRFVRPARKTWSAKDVSSCDSIIPPCQRPCQISIEIPGVISLACIGQKRNDKLY